MESVGAIFRRTLRQRLAALTAGERVALTARLADADLDLFCAARGLPRAEARRMLQRRRSGGRRPSCVNEVGP